MTAETATTFPRLTLRMTEIADLLGVGLSTVQRWVAAGDLPAVRPPGGGVVLIKPQDLEEFLEQHREGKGVPPKAKLRRL